VRPLLPGLAVLFVALIHILSLFHWLADAPEAALWFDGRLAPWAAQHGLPQLFASDGVLGPRAVGYVEALIAGLLLAGLVRGRIWLQLAGAALSVIFVTVLLGLHLASPLGVSLPLASGGTDGGRLFGLAMLLWLGSLAILWLRVPRNAAAAR